MKIEFDGLTIEIISYLILVKYDKSKNFSDLFLNRVRDLIEIGFPSYKIYFIETNVEAKINENK